MITRVTAPSNVWTVECVHGDPWPAGVRGERLLERPSGTRLASAVWELDPGAASPAYHVHHATEELLLLLRGEAILRTPEGERTLHEGDVAHFPIGAAGAHQVINRSRAVVRYLMVAAHSGLDIIEYVDDAKVVAYSNADSLLQGELFFWHRFCDGNG
jgi:uncharacterized cupin superfamily protein